MVNTLTELEGAVKGVENLKNREKTGNHIEIYTHSLLLFRLGGQTWGRVTQVRPERRDGMTN